MGNYNRDDRGGNRGGFQSRGRSSFSSRGRSSFGGGRSFDRGNDRQMFKATCDNCGKECEVPFRPTSGKPVYCSDCFEKMGGRDARVERVERPEFRAATQAFDQRKDFEILNVKLDRILKLLEPKTVISEPVLEEVKKIKAPKVKKVVSEK